MPVISTKVLKWARESSGLSVKEVVEKLGWKSTEKFEQIEAGELIPTRGNLDKLADIYRRPVLTFYLSEPPKSVQPAQDFRMLVGADAKSEKVLETLVRDIRARQELLRSALEEADEAVTFSFVGSVRTLQNPSAVARTISESIGFTGDEFARNRRGVDEAFKRLRSAVESSGVFVVLANNLGSHHTDLGVDVFRGFALSDPFAPLIVINPSDSKSAWAFTLIHELTHIWIGRSALSGYQSDSNVEKFCDEVAASFLIGGDLLRDYVLDRSSGLGTLATSIESLANDRNLSRKMIAYNLMTLGRISRTEYSGLARIFDTQRVAAVPNEEDESSGPSYYVVRRHRLGRRLVSTVERLVSQGVLSTTKAGKVLGVKPTAVFKTFEVKRAA